MRFGLTANYRECSWKRRAGGFALIRNSEWNQPGVGLTLEDKNWRKTSSCEWSSLASAACCCPLFSLFFFCYFTAIVSCLHRNWKRKYFESPTTAKYFPHWKVNLVPRSNVQVMHNSEKIGLLKTCATDSKAHRPLYYHVFLINLLFTYFPAGFLHSWIFFCVRISHATMFKHFFCFHQYIFVFLF